MLYPSSPRLWRIYGLFRKLLVNGTYTTREKQLVILSCVQVDTKGACRGFVPGNPLTIDDKSSFFKLGVIIASFSFKRRTLIWVVTILFSHSSQYSWKPRTQSYFFRALIYWLLYVSLFVKTSSVMALNLPLKSWYSWSCYFVHDVLLSKPSTSITPLS